jgi:subtilisin-like proprotein convertase family protein
MKRIALSLMALLLGTTVVADVVDPRAAALPLEQIAAWQSPAVDVAALRAEDLANRDVPGVPRRIGFPMATDLTPANSGTWEALSAADRLWRLRVRSDGALWIVLGFDEFWLQAGAQLWVRDLAGETVLGPYTSRDVRDHGELWFPPVAGDELVVELLWPASLEGDLPRLHLGTVSHGYEPFGAIGRDAAGMRDPSTTGFGDSGSCNIDVACPLGDAWRDQIRGALILLSGGSGFCSGSLINTTAGDCRPYVLTAAHCNAGASTTFGFNFERPECGAGTPLPPTNQTVTGATVLANYSDSDVTLLQMDSDPPAEFDVYYNGWSRDPTASLECWTIHHPSGDAKKISHNDDPLVDGSFYGPDHWRITEWEEGTTEGGSSGSPLFDTDQRIVGQLHGGFASCTNITWDEYGKLDVSWTGGGTPGTRLSDWLDPLDKGWMGIDGVDASTCEAQLAGTVQLSAERFSCSDTVQITLRDDHLTGQVDHDVTLRSTTETTPEIVTLGSTDTETGRFAGTIAIDAVAAINGDGVLAVAHDDTITAEYVDADDGAGGTDVVVQALATVDCLPPLISNVAASQISGSSAWITWETDEPAAGAVTYGLAPGGGSTVEEPGWTTGHGLRLEGLPSCTAHYYAVGSSDEVGNAALDDAGGAWHTFETLREVRPEYQTTTPVPIPDNDPTGVASSITVPDTETILDLDVVVQVTHGSTGDLTLRLEAPGRQTVVLSDHRGGNGADFLDTRFDDEATIPVADGSAPFNGSYRPDEALSLLDGTGAAGIWQLRAVDEVGNVTGTLDGWSLIATYPGAACGPHASVVEHLPLSDSCATGGTGDADGGWDPGELAGFSLTLKNDGITTLTDVTARVTAITAGVVMIEGVAAYPDLPPGSAAASSAPHFTALLPASAGCGEPIAFRVDVATAQGRWTEEFSQPIGRIVPASGVVLDEDFAAGIPGDWTIVDGSTDTWTWFADDASDPAGCGSLDPAAPISGPWAAVDSNCAGPVTMDEELISPPMSIPAASSVSLDFDHFFFRYSTEVGDVEVRSSLTGGAWVNLARYETSTPNPAHESFDLTSLAAGADDVQLRFRYHNASYEWYWYLDNVVVGFSGATACESVACAADPAAPAPVPALTLAWSDGALSASWDATCAPSSAKLLYGPLGQVAGPVPTGEVCAITNPQVLDPAPDGDLWFLVVGQSASGVESSWGPSSYGERHGLAASGTCGSTVKDVTDTCPLAP